MSGILQNFQGGLELAQSAKQGQQVNQQFMAQSEQRNKLAEFLTPQNMAGIMSGDANALAGYAAASGNPMGAMKLQEQALQTQGAGLSNQATQQSMDIQRKKFEFEVNQQAAQMTADQRKAAAEKTRQAVQAGMTVQTPEQWDQLATQMGQTDLVGQFENREGLLATYLDAADIMERFDDQNAEPEPYKAQSIPGKIAQDKAAGIDIAGGSGADFETEQKLRKEFSALPAVKAFSSVKDAYGRIAASADDPSPAGDLALIFNFMKVLDPGSVVRESEFATAESAAAWLQESEETGATIPLPIARGIRKMATGQRLSPEQRNDFVQRSEGLFRSQEQNYNQQVNRYRDLAERYNLEPDAIAMVAEKYNVEPEVAAEALNKGEIQAPKSATSLPKTFLDGVGSPDMAQATWDAMTPEQRALFE